MMEEGDICWAKLTGHPWWPALICKHPVQKLHVKQQAGDKCRHVQFFDKPPTRAWVKEKNIRIFTGSEETECQKGGQFFTTKKSVLAAMKHADKAMFMIKKERLKMVVEKAPAEDNIRSPLMPTFDVATDAETPIPAHWKSAYVLMATNDIPEGLAPGVPAYINKQGKAVLVKTEVPDFDLESEEEMLDSDNDPGWEPDPDETASKKRKTTFDEEEEEDAVDDVDDVDDLEEDISDSDEDPGWAPSEKKKGLEGALTKKKKPPVKRTKLKPKPSTSSSTPAPTAGPKSPTSPSSQKQILIKDKEATGPEPAIGDYLVEKAEVKNGEIPFLWRFKKGGLIQKFEKVIDDNGKELYQNALNFSDWWGCYADRYVKVNTKTMFRHRNVEKIELLTLPDEIEELVKSSANGATSSSKTSPPATKPKRATPRASSTKTSNASDHQEQEVSSTTSDPEYQVGQYILDKKEERNVDNFAVWKIESNILLKKYEMVIKKGKMYHKPVKTYRGYRDISKYYLPLKTRRAHDPHDDGMIEVLEESRPKLHVEKNMEEEYDKNPLLHHFYVYMQVFLSQALEPGFLAEVNKNKDETYTFPMGEIDKIVRQKMEQIERKMRWSTKIKMALQRAPYLREVYKPDEKKKCEALVESDDPVEEVAFLFGDEYDIVTLKSKGTQQSQEFKIGKTAVSHIGPYHQLCHFKYNLYDKCLAKVKLVRDSKEGTEPEVEDIMDQCLGNKSWVLQNFVDFNNLIQMP